MLKVELLPARYPKAEVSPAAYAGSVAAEGRLPEADGSQQPD
ncbi:hypothetical protein [Micromonospora sp. NPDC047134]